MPTIPKPVTKVITERKFGPISRADASAKKAETPTQEEEEDTLPEGFFEDEDEVPSPAQKTPPPAQKREVADPELDSVLDAADKDLDFLSSGKKRTSIQREKGAIPTERPHPPTPPKVPEKDLPPISRPSEEIDLTPPEDFLTEKDGTIAGTRPSPSVWDDLKKKEPEGSEECANITPQRMVYMNFSKTFKESYRTSAFEEKPCFSNVFVEKIHPEDPEFEAIVFAHAPNNPYFISSPFKFLEKTDFLRIFQKAFLGAIFELSYATPYYKTKEGLHQIYFSSYTTRKADITYVTLLDLVSPAGNGPFYREVKLNENLSTFEAHQIFRVSINVLFL